MTEQTKSQAVNLEELPEVRPIMCTRQQLPKYFPGMTARTWANLAHLKQGPEFFRKGKLAWYEVDTVADYLKQNPVKTSK
ncbi:MAG: hypothetical protein IIA63_03005 [Nitrospinae bacterium]|nr:hypothetical protein [Nitrospinota bacterium]